MVDLVELEVIAVLVNERDGVLTIVGTAAVVLLMACIIIGAIVYK